MEDGGVPAVPSLDISVARARLIRRDIADACVVLGREELQWLRRVQVFQHAFVDAVECSVVLHGRPCTRVAGSTRLARRGRRRSSTVSTVDRDNHAVTPRPAETETRLMLSRRSLVNRLRQARLTPTT